MESDGIINLLLRVPHLFTTTSTSQGSRRDGHAFQMFMIIELKQDYKPAHKTYKPAHKTYNSNYVKTTTTTTNNSIFAATIYNL